MSASRTWPVVMSLAIAILIPGCEWGNQAQMARYQAANQQLAEQARAQLTVIGNLEVHNRKIEGQLNQAELELASIDEQFGISRRKLANYTAERERLQFDFATTDGLGGVPPGVRGQLAELARRYPSLHYDPQTGISKLDTDVLFDSGEDRLKPEAGRMLDDFSAIMESPEARPLKIMVVGHTDDQPVRGRETRHRFPTNWHLSAARALAVAKRLRNTGIDGERMGMAAFGMHQPIAKNDSAPSRQQNRRVEIFVMSTDVPVVGMTDTLIDLY